MTATPATTRDRIEAARPLAGAAAGCYLRLASDATTRTAIAAEPVTIGSGPRCAVRIVEAGLKPLCCVVSRRGGEVFVRRWASGVQLNGADFVEAPLAEGDVLTVGSETIELSYEEGVAANDSVDATPCEPKDAFAVEPESGRAYEVTTGSAAADGALRDKEREVEQLRRRLENSKTRMRRLVALVRESRTEAENQASTAADAIETLRGELESTQLQGAQLTASNEELRDEIDAALARIDSLQVEATVAEATPEEFSAIDADETTTDRLDWGVEESAESQDAAPSTDDLWDVEREAEDSVEWDVETPADATADADEITQEQDTAGESVEEFDPVDESAIAWEASDEAPKSAPEFDAEDSVGPEDESTVEPFGEVDSSEAPSVDADASDVIEEAGGSAFEATPEDVVAEADDQEQDDPVWGFAEPAAESSDRVDQADEPAADSTDEVASTAAESIADDAVSAPEAAASDLWAIESPVESPAVDEAEESEPAEPIEPEVAADADAAGEPEQADESAAPGESFYERYAHLLPQDDEEEAEGESFATVAPQAPEATPSADLTDDDDGSIDDYLQQMMARIRTDGPPTAAPVTVEPIVAAPAASEAGDAAEPNEVEEKSEPLVDLEEIRSREAPEKDADMTSLRQLANQSARGAMVTADTNQTKEQALRQFLVAITATAFGCLACFTTQELFGWRMFVGFTGVIVGGYLGLQTFYELQVAIRREAAEQAAAEAEHADHED